MNKAMQDIKKYITGFKVDLKGNISADIVFPEDFICFQGHFPGKPILPGICKILAIKTILEGYFKEAILIKEIVLAKFFAPVLSGQKIHLECSFSHLNETEVLVKTFITNQEKKIAQIEMVMEGRIKL